MRHRPEVTRERVADLVEAIELSDARDWPADDPLPEHLQIRFRRPVRGPLLIGRERHAGLGLMVPSGR